MTLKIRYVDGSVWLTVALIHIWKRGDIPEMVMSTSSGPKDQIKNRIFAAFQDQPSVDRIAMLHGRGPVFLVLRSGGRWYDVTAREVETVNMPA